MTKAQAVSEDKKGESEKIPAITFYQKKEKHYEDTCWYLLSLITALVCCVPCGVVGLMNAMIAKQEALRDNEAGYRNCVRNAKVCTVVAVVFGLMTIASVAMLSFLFATTLLEAHKLHERLNDALYEARKEGYTSGYDYVYNNYDYESFNAKTLRWDLNNTILHHLNRDKEERRTTKEPWTRTPTTKYPYYPDYTTEQPLVTEEVEYEATGRINDSSTFSPTEMKSFNAATAEPADKPSFLPDWL